MITNISVTIFLIILLSRTFKPGGNRIAA
jgi:hypothetical protein